MMKKNENNKITYLLISILLTFLLTVLSLSTFFIPEKINSLEIKQNELYLLNKLDRWKIGNNYELHDPFYEEIEIFIENKSLTFAKESIDAAKIKGLRCAYAQVIMGEELYMYDLIAFDTIDKGFVYFQPEKQLFVTPIIGKTYKECIIDNQQNFSTFNDTIVDIIYIW
jgi:hypothetical protein